MGMSAINSTQGLWLGLDTGGTFTDAVLLDDRRVIASAKALTTPWNLAIGIGEAIRAVLHLLPAGAGRQDVSLVSVSTTLATNAVVENRFSPVCTLLIGFDDAMVERSGLQRPGSGGLVVRVAGGHGATGEEAAALDENAPDAARHERFTKASPFVSVYLGGGNGMNSSSSPGTRGNGPSGAPRRSSQSRFARSSRSSELDTKFHHRWRGSGNGWPPTTTKRAPAADDTGTESCGASTSMRPGANERPPHASVPLMT